MTTTQPRKFRLSFVNAAEDVPRLIRAYGRACEGEFALVMRPPEARGVLVLVTKKDGAFFWRGPSSPVENGDAPARPESPIAAKDAVALVKTEQKGVPKPGPITLRGQWRGWLHCDDGQPKVELERKLATYGVLRIVSDGAKGWAWTVERTEKWFSKPGQDSGKAMTLIKAIEGGLARAMGLLGEACSVRDSRRRAALDSEYAVDRPVRPAREGKDPTERLKPKEPRAAKAKAGSPWRHYAHDDEVPEADPIDKPTRAMLTKVRADGLQHDAGAGTFLGKTVEVFDGFPVGSLVFRGPEDNAGFYLHPPLVTRARKGKAAGATKAEGAVAKPMRMVEPEVVGAGAVEADAAKDKALLDAFSQAIAAALKDVA